LNGNQLLIEILRYYSINVEKGIPYKSELERLSSLNELTFENLVFPYKFVDKYNNNIIVCRDTWKFPYIILPDKRKLYFPKDWTDPIIKFNYQLLMVEQDPESPHYYIPISPNSDITLDIGCAEANFTLLNYIHSKEFHLFDTDEYRDAIHKTFKDNDNVIYHIGTVNANNKIDSIEFNGKVDNIKIDVEGMEYEVLIGAMQTILRDKPFIQVCTYHTKEAFEEIYTLLKSLGYKDIKCSKGYMIFPKSYQEPPYFRKGVLYANY
jgi:hypothetical protein